jgi:hypothetical protein
MEVLNALAFVYSIGFLVAAYVMAVRSQAVVRQRVRERGRPVSPAYAYSYLAWAVAKAVVWPIVLTLWIALGKPAPGTWSNEGSAA